MNQREQRKGEGEQIKKIAETERKRKRKREIQTREEENEKGGTTFDGVLPLVSMYASHVKHFSFSGTAPWVCPIISNKITCYIPTPRQK